MYNSIIDYASEGLIEIDSAGYIYSINEPAKKIIGIENDFIVPHPRGVIEDGDVVVFVTNRLGADDGTKSSSFECLSYFEKLEHNNPFCIVGTFSGSGENEFRPVVPHVQSDTNYFESVISYRGIDIEVSANIPKRRLSIVVNGKDFSFDYIYAIGHIVVINPKNNFVKFYQARGFTARGESVGELLLKKEFREKKTRNHLSKELNPKNIFSIVKDFDLSSVIKDLSSFEVTKVLYDSDVKRIKDSKFENQYILLNNLPVMFSLYKQSHKVSEENQRFIIKMRDLSNFYTMVQTHNDAFKLLNDLRTNKNSDMYNPLEGFIGTTPAITNLKKEAKKASKSNSNVLLLGESGTGKSKLAKLIHSASSRSEKPFIHVNCASIPSSLVESELFGYEPGSFTGALSKGKLGYFESAKDGTIFLDEIGELSIDMQTKLLKVLQEKMFYKVGGNKNVKMKARIISATNKNLDLLVKNGQFREDLYYRLYVIPILIPPLRDRLDDINELSWSLLPKICENLDIDLRFIAYETINKLLKYDYPGNIRELENILERAINRCEGVVINPEDVILPGNNISINENVKIHSDKNHLGEYFKVENIKDKSEVSSESDDSLSNFNILSLKGSLKERLKECEKLILTTELIKNQNDKKRTMEELSIKKSAFYQKVK